MNGTSNISKSTIIKWIVNIGLPLVVFLIPCGEVYTMQMKLFFVTTLFAICAFALETMDQTGVAILLPVTWVFLGVAQPGVIFGPWSQYIAWVTLGGFFLANVLQRVGLLSRFVYWVVSKTGVNYRGIVLGLAVAVMLLTQFTGEHPMLIATICYGICMAFGFGVSKASAGIMLTGAVSTIIANQFRFTGPINVIGVANSAGFQLNLLGFVESWFYNLPIILFWLGTVIMILLMFKPEKDIEGKTYFEEKLAEMGKMTLDEKKALAVLVIFMGYVLTQKIHGLSLEWGMAIIPWLLLFPGIGCAKPEDVKKINYGMVFFMITCMGIGSVATSLGIGKILTGIAAPLLTGKSVYVLFITIWFIMFICNFAMTPLAMIAAFSVPLLTLAESFGVNPMAICYFMITSFDQIILPYEYAKYLMFFGFGLISMKDFMKFGVGKSILNFIICFAVLIPWWMITGFLYV